MKLKPGFMDFDPKIGHSSVSTITFSKKKKKKCKHELVTFNFFNVI